MTDYKPEVAVEVRIAYMQRDIDILKIQMSELKLFAEKASTLFHTINLLQHQLEGFDNRLDEKLELFSMRLENKINDELQDMIEKREQNQVNQIRSVMSAGESHPTPAPEPVPATSKINKDVLLIILYLLIIAAGVLNIRLPTPGG